MAFKHLTLTRIRHLNGLIRRQVLPPLRGVRSGSTEEIVADEENDKPIKYSSSEAAAWRAEFTRSGPEDNKPWFQTHVINLTLMVFLGYFCILREENDIDAKFDRELVDYVPDTEDTEE